MSGTNVTSELNLDAPDFIPSFLRPQLSGPAASFQSPVVFLMFGCRGAGKSTHSLLLAQRYNLLYLSSGDIHSAGKQPFIELRKILKENFGDGKAIYNGVVLDRFIANSEFEAFYVQSALRSVGLPVPFVFLLAVDPLLAAKRAEGRGDKKSGNQRWRAVEQKAQAVTANTVYAPIQCLKIIKVEEGMTVDDVFDEIKMTVERGLPSGLASITLPHQARKEMKGAVLIEEYETFIELANDVHTAVGNICGRRDSAPLSSVGGYLDKEYFSFGRKKLRSQLSTMHVTLKVDGLRFSMIKHREHGYIGFPSAFTHCYDLNGLLGDVQMNAKSYTNLKKWINEKLDELRVDFILDTEIVVIDSQPVLHVIDFVYFWGLDGRRMFFEQRLKVLRGYFEEMNPPRDVVVLKDYVPVNRVRTLTEEMERKKLPNDGLIFQHSGTYRCGLDKFLLKWKPVHLCTVDFRLANGVMENGIWKFDLFVTDDCTDNGEFREIPYPGATMLISPAVVEENGLKNGIIVESILVEKDSVKKTSSKSQVEATKWAFRNVRNDKPSPNKFSVVSRIGELVHVNLEELVRLCEGIPYCGSL